jgi:hypothetical protein
MNLVVAALLDAHARIAAETRGEAPQTEAEKCLRTEVDNGSSEDNEDNKQMRIQNECK